MKVSSLKYFKGKVAREPFRTRSPSHNTQRNSKTVFFKRSWVPFRMRTRFPGPPCTHIYIYYVYYVPSVRKFPAAARFESRKRIYIRLYGRARIPVFTTSGTYNIESVKTRVLPRGLHGTDVRILNSRRDTVAGLPGGGGGGGARACVCGRGKNPRSALAATPSDIMFSSNWADPGRGWPKMSRGRTRRDPRGNHVRSRFISPRLPLRGYIPGRRSLGVTYVVRSSARTRHQLCPGENRRTRHAVRSFKRHPPPPTPFSCWLL